MTNAPEERLRGQFREQTGSMETMMIEVYAFATPNDVRSR